MEEHSWQLHLDQLPRHRNVVQQGASFYTCQIWYAVNWYKLTECRIWESVQKIPVELKPWWTDCLDPCCIKIGCRWLHIVFMMSLEAQKKKQYSTIKTICGNLQVKRLSSACPKSCFESCSNMFSILELYNSVEEFVAKVQVALSPWKGSIERGNVDLPNRLAWNTDCMDCRDCMDCLCNQLLTTSIINAIINAFINDYHLKSFVPWIADNLRFWPKQFVCWMSLQSIREGTWKMPARWGRTSVDRSDRSRGLRGLGVVSESSRSACHSCRGALSGHTSFPVHKPHLRPWNPSRDMYMICIFFGTDSMWYVYYIHDMSWLEDIKGLVLLACNGYNLKNKCKQRSLRSKRNVCT